MIYLPFMIYLPYCYSRTSTETRTMQQDIEKWYHDVHNSIIIIRRLSESVDPLLERVSKCCANGSISSVGTPRQLEIAQQSMKTIGVECEKLLEYMDRIYQKNENQS